MFFKSYIPEFWLEKSLLLFLENRECHIPSEKMVPENHSSPDGYGSVGGATSCKVKCCWFNSLSGHMPGLQVQSLVGKRTIYVFSHICFSPCLSPSLPFSLKINKMFSFLKRKKIILILRVLMISLIKTFKAVVGPRLAECGTNGAGSLTTGRPCGPTFAYR